MLRSGPLTCPAPLTAASLIQRKLWKGRDCICCRCAGIGLHRQPSRPALKRRVGPEPTEETDCSSTACQDQHLESFSTVGAPSPSAAMTTRNLGPVSDTSLHAVPPAKNQELGAGEDSGGPGRVEGLRRRMFHISPGMDVVLSGEHCPSVPTPWDGDGGHCLRTSSSPIMTVCSGFLILKMG